MIDRCQNRCLYLYSATLAHPVDIANTVHKKFHLALKLYPSPRDLEPLIWLKLQNSLVDVIPRNRLEQLSTYSADIVNHKYNKIIEQLSKFNFLGCEITFINEINVNNKLNKFSYVT